MSEFFSVCKGKQLHSLSICEHSKFIFGFVEKWSCVSADASDFMDTDVLDAHLDSVSRSEACDVNHFDSAFTNAFLKTDEEFGKVRLLPG